MATQTRPERAHQAQTVERDAQAPRLSLLEEILDRTDARRDLEALLPKGESLNRITALVALQQRKDLNLAKCTPGSLVDAVATILRWGLTIGETAYLVPRYMKKDGVWRCTAIADYKGLVHLMRLSRIVRGISYDCVYEGEYFEYENGAYPVLRHRPFTRAAEKRKMLGAYVVVRLAHNQVEITYLPVDEIDAIRTQYSQGWKGGECPPWYAIKTCIRRVAKLLPKDPGLARVFHALREDEEAEFGAAEQLRALDDLEVPAEPTFPDDTDDMPEHHAAHVPAGARSRAVADPDAEYGGEDWESVGEAMRDGETDADPYGLGLDDAPPVPKRRRSAVEEGH